MVSLSFLFVLSVLLVVASYYGVVLHGRAETDLRGNKTSSSKVKELKSKLMKDQPLMESSDLFEGDIITDLQQVTVHYGAEIANIVQMAGLLKKPQNDEKLNERNLGIMITYDKMWKIRDKYGIVIVPYQIRGSVPKNLEKMIKLAMKTIELETQVVKFRQRTNEPDWIYFRNYEQACWSYVGRDSGLQEINVVPACGIGGIIHEIFHSLGFWHEQSRSDRDKYVKINWDNIESGYEHNFYKQSTNSLGSEYNYHSIMHYGATAFGRDDWVCQKTEVKSNTVSLIHFQRSDVDSNLDYCLNVQDGDKGLYDGQEVNIRPCGEKSYKNQYWIIEAFGERYNVYRLASNPQYCLTVDYEFYVPDGSPLIIRKCIENTFTYQRFAQQQPDWNEITFFWEYNHHYVITRDKGQTSTPNTYKVILEEYGLDDAIDQTFAVTFATKTTGRSAAINAFCDYMELTTIDAMGHVIGQRVALDPSDILQLQLLYQCPHGPRNLTNFCSEECKCKVNQGNCTNSNQCTHGLKCEYDGVSLNRCVLDLDTICSYHTKQTCNKNKLCLWAVVNHVSKCTPFSCNKILGRRQCISYSKQCEWISSTSVCVSNG